LLSADFLKYWAPAFVLAITVHEAAHAWVASLLGDRTARDLGRLTLNPLKHLDVAGTIVFFLVGFGWAKPVPVDPRNLKNPLRDHMWIAAAGPGANVALAVVSGILWRLQLLAGGTDAASGAVSQLLWGSVTINLLLALFNLIPLQPLDGSGVIQGLLPATWLPRYRRLNAVGPALLLGAILLGNVLHQPILSNILWPPVSWLRSMLTGV